MSERSDGRSNDDRGTSSDGDPPGDEPLGDLARRVRERGTKAGNGGDGDGSADGADDGPEHAVDRAGDGEDAFDDGVGVADTHSGGDETDSDADALFEEMDVTEVDPDRVWESVLDEADDESLRDLADSATTSEVDPDPAVGRDPAPDVDAEHEDDGHLVRKRAYCESCQYFTAPPEVACTYDGGEIVEVVDSDRFRVRNCPVVAGRIDTDGVALGDGDLSVDDIE